jgi:hypothetical protein
MIIKAMHVRVMFLSPIDYWEASAASNSLEKKPLSQESQAMLASSIHIQHPIQI